MTLRYLGHLDLLTLLVLHPARHDLAGNRPERAVVAHLAEFHRLPFAYGYLYVLGGVEFADILKVAGADRLKPQVSTVDTLPVSLDRVGVLIVDNDLPNINVVELIRRTRALAHRQRAPIIMLSDGEVEAESRRAGVNKFLPKPSGISVLAETVAHLLARKKGRETGAM